MKSKTVWSININYEPINTDPKIALVGTNIYKIYSDLKDAYRDKELLKEKFLESITKDAITKFEDYKGTDKLVQQYKYIKDVHSRLNVYIEEVEYLEKI